MSNPIFLFGKVVGGSGDTPAQSPTSSQFSPQVVHHKPRIVNQPSRDEEDSSSENIVVEEAESDPREPTPSQTQELNHSPAQQAHSSSTRAARVIVTPKKHKLVVDTVLEDSSSHEGVDMEIEIDPIQYPDRFYTDPPLARAGKGVLAKRAKGKSYGGGGKAPRGGVGGKVPRGVGGKTPRGVGGKAPRVPNGAGKSPAFSARERQEQQQRVKFLSEPLEIVTQPTQKSKRKMNTALGNMPVGAKPEKRPKRRLEKWQKEVIEYEKSCEFLIRRGSFQRLVREIALDQSMQEWRWARTALEALQWAAEDYLTEEFDLGNQAAMHAKRVTIRNADLQLVGLIQDNPK